MLPTWSSSLAYCSQLWRGHESRSSRASPAFSAAASNRPRQDVDPAALQQNAVDVQRLLHLPPMPLGVPETLVGVVELVQRHGDQAEVQPAPRNVVRPVALGYRRICLVYQRLGLPHVTRRPRRRAAFELCSRSCQVPSPGFGAGACSPQPGLRLRQPAGLDAEAAISRGALDQQMVIGLAAVARPVDGLDHLLPQRNRLDVEVVVAQRVLRRRSARR